MIINKRRKIGFFNTKNSKVENKTSKEKVIIRTGEIRNVDLGKESGYKINGIRPCLILRQVRRTFVVLPLSKFNGKLHISEVLIQKKQGNLNFDSVIKVGQIQTVSEEKILDQFGVVTNDILEIVAKKLQNFFIQKILFEMALKEVRA